MAQSFHGTKSGRLGMLASIAIVVGGLYFARDVLIPIALAVMLSFLLTPLLLRLQRWGLPRIPALILVMLLLISAIGGLGFVVYSQLNDLAGKLDQYKQNIQEKVNWVRGVTDNAAIDKAMKVFKETTEKSTTKTTTAPTTAATAPVATIQTNATGESELTPINPLTHPANPIPVLVTNEKPAEATGGSPFKNIYASFSPLLDPLATAGIVLIFVIFMLMAREDLRDRVIRLIGQGRINVTTQAMDEAATRVSRYLIAQCIVNGTYGLSISVGLWLIGKTFGHSNPSFPNWFLWGLLTGLLRFIPYIGPWIGAAFPIAISLAVYHGMSVPLAVIGMFLLIELLSNNLMEPWLYGASTGVSTVAILVAAVFWTWLWGTPGLLLSTPLTVLIAVTGKYVPQLEFLNILLGDEPALEPKYRFYQRLLADDVEEADDLMAEYLKEKPVVKIYDEVVLPALSLAEHDWHNDRLDQAKQASVRQAVRDLVEEVGEKPRKISADQPEQEAVRDETGGYQRCVLCLPARDPADEIAAMMLAQVLEREGYCAEYVSVERLASEYVELVEKKGVQVVMISALPPAAVTHARYLVKRLRARFPDLKVIVGLWTMRGNLERARERLEQTGSNLVVDSIEHAVEQLRQTVQPLILDDNADAKQAQGDAKRGR
jgi:predicted PurR-regulated permease PerM/methylmalonyl-CoA mutase cobalamin-binding subunit